MARIIRPHLTDPATYHGLDWIFEHTNFDGNLTRWNCGQAAAATFLTHHGLMDPVQAAKNMSQLEATHPPDQLAGYFGTGRRRIERILRAYQIDYLEVDGADGLKQQLDARNPVLLMLGLPTGKFLDMDLPGGHWMVAYGYDRERLHVTNGSTFTWEELHRAWNTLTTRWIRMNGRGLAKRHS